MCVGLDISSGSASNARKLSQLNNIRPVRVGDLASSLGKGGWRKGGPEY